MSQAFGKYQLNDERALQRFKRKEPHTNPHDHPFAFETTILDGGYVEGVFTFDAHSWRGILLHRLPGSTYRVATTHIHRIVEQPQRGSRSANAGCWGALVITRAKADLAVRRPRLV
jgi:butyrate kinase